MEFLELKINVKSNSIETIKSLLPKAINDFLITEKKYGSYQCDVGNFYFILNNLEEETKC